METPSKRRRDGRNAFDPNTDPMEVQPYNPNTWSYGLQIKEWLEGWHEGREIWEAKQDIEKSKEKHIILVLEDIRQKRNLSHHFTVASIENSIEWNVGDPLSRQQVASIMKMPNITVKLI